MFIFYLFVFITGLAIGSFLNVVIYRLENGEDIVRDRSHCMDCKHNLAWYDLVPVASFLLLGGKCRYCGKPISWQYPLIEMITALLFVLSLRATGGSAAISYLATGEIASSLLLLAMTLATTFYLLLIISSLIVIFVYDLKHYIIPDKIIYLTVVISLFYAAYPTISSFFGYILSDNFQFSIFNFQSILNSQILNLSFFNKLFAAFLAGGFFLSIVLITRGQGMGGGDVKLAFLMGLVLGWPNILLALFLAFTLGAICGIILMLFKKKSFKSEIPFGPFLVIGTMIAMFWGEEVMKWYGNYLF